MLRGDRTRLMSFKISFTNTNQRLAGTFSLQEVLQGCIVQCKKYMLTVHFHVAFPAVLRDFKALTIQEHCRSKASVCHTVATPPQKSH